MIQTQAEFSSIGIYLRKNITSWPSVGLDNRFISKPQYPLQPPLLYFPAVPWSTFQRLKKQCWNNTTVCLIRQLLLYRQVPLVLIPTHACFPYSPMLGLDAGVCFSPQVIFAPLLKSQVFLSRCESLKLACPLSHREILIIQSQILCVNNRHCRSCIFNNELLNL